MGAGTVTWRCPGGPLQPSDSSAEATAGPGGAGMGTAGFPIVAFPPPPPRAWETLLGESSAGAVRAPPLPSVRWADALLLGQEGLSRSSASSLPPLPPQPRPLSDSLSSSPPCLLFILPFLLEGCSLRPFSRRRCPKQNSPFSPAEEGCTPLGAAPSPRARLTAVLQRFGNGCDRCAGVT